MVINSRDLSHKKEKRSVPYLRLVMAPKKKRNAFRLNGHLVTTFPVSCMSRVVIFRPKGPRPRFVTSSHAGLCNIYILCTFAEGGRSRRQVGSGLGPSGPACGLESGGGACGLGGGASAGEHVRLVLSDALRPSLGQAPSLSQPCPFLISAVPLPSTNCDLAPRAHQVQCYRPYLLPLLASYTTGL